MRTLLALAGAFLLVIAGIGTLAAFSDPADEARMTAAEVRIACLEAGEPCPPETPTAEPTATEHEHENVGTCGESNDTWHPAIVDGCATGHEHGDAPPAWVTASAWQPAFTHAGNTPGENELSHKHSAFKGHFLTDSGVTVYGVFHLDFNPGGHVNRFHSYQIWALDPQGGVSHWSGWFNFGATPNNFPETWPTGPQVRRIHCDNTDVRPIMAVNDEGCGPVQFESWYSRAGAAPWDVGFNIKATYYLGGDPSDPGTWSPIGQMNDVRRFEAAIYPDRLVQRGTFWLTQFREPVSGPNDPLCGTQRQVGERSYTRICLEQYVAPTMIPVTFPGNSRQATYSMAGVVLPN